MPCTGVVIVYFASWDLILPSRFSDEANNKDDSARAVLSATASRRFAKTKVEETQAESQVPKHDVIQEEVAVKFTHAETSGLEKTFEEAAAFEPAPSPE